MTEPRSWLFVPADSERKITRALDSEADAIIFDLEDSVAPGLKSVARDVLKHLPARSGGPEWMRRAEPALRGIKLAAFLRCVLYSLLRLLLGTDEQHLAPFADSARQKIAGGLQLIKRFA